MRWLTQLRLRLRSLFFRRNVEQELEEELRYHIERQMEEDIASGASPDEAQLAARRALLGIEARKEECRDMRGLNLFDNLTQDVRFAVRQLRKSPGFTGAATLVLTLGFCAAIAIFAFVDAALLKPLPYPNPERLVDVTEYIAAMPRANLSYLDYLDWKKANEVFESFEVYTQGGFLLSTPTGATPVPAARVTDGFLRTLGVRPMLGRDFYAGESSPGAPHTAILTASTWHKRFGGRKDIIGQAILLSGEPYTVIGVMPSEFHFAPVGSVELWVTNDGTGSCEKRRSCHNLYGIARLKEGVSVQTALSNVTTIARRLEQQYPDSNRGQGAIVAQLSEVIVGRIRPLLFMLLAGAGLLLLIACVNVSSLLLVRAENRRREIAVRGALGATAGRLFGQFVTEGILLVATGITFGLIAAKWAIQLLLKLIPDDTLNGMPFLLGLSLNLRVLLCAGALALLAAVMFSLTPALHMSFSRMRQGLTEGSRGSAGLTWRRLGARLVVVEFATAMVLLAAAGLLGKSLYRLLHVELGFQPDRLATLMVAAPDNNYGKNEQAIALGREVVSRMQNLPGVESVGLVTTLPANFNGNTTWVRIVGKPYNGEHNEVNERDVSSAYFTTIGAKLLSGRYFADSEDETKPHVVIINETFARKYFAGEDPIGKQIGDNSLSPKSLTQVVGVIADIREGTLDSEIWPAVYHPFNQDPSDYFAVLVRSSQEPGSLLTAMTSAIHQLHPDIGTIGESTMKDRINRAPTTYMHRSAAWLVGGFAALALFLGVVGLYGVVAYSVSQRTREIGVRMALGAEPKYVYRLILKEAAGLVTTATVLGIIASLSAATMIRGLLYSVHSWDISNLVLVVAVLVISAMLASYVPARRAAAVNPVEALRAE